MPARKTKSFSRKEVSLPLLLTLGGLGVLTLVYASGFFSLTTASNAGSIQANDRVTVDGVNNTTQYLTSMVLHAPGTNEKVTLNYDPALNALRIKGAVNADGLIIGNNEASVGNTILGGTNNQATQGTNTNSLIVGGESNKLNDASNSAIIGGQNNTLLNTENVAVIGSSQTTFPLGEKRENIFIVGGTGNQVKGSNVFILGEGENVAGSDMVLMGKKIKAWEKDKIFVWSDDQDQEFFPQRSNAFYVNTTKGIGLNTNDPKVKFDAGQAGGVRIGNPASKVNNCSSNYAGVMAYVHVGGKSGFCGCNGQTWVPLTADPSIQAVCINMQKSPCAGVQPLNANKGAEITLPVWDPNANNGDGAFMPKNWMYTNASPKAECTYDCQIGYHPGQNNPEGKHLDGACKACSSIDRRYTAGAHNGWKTAGKGNDNCDFSCVGGSFYKNTASQRACPLCSTGKSVATLVSKISGNTHYDKAWYSPDDNQLATCSECTNKPVNAKYTQKDVNSATGACPWECADGYNKRGNDCLKATWQEKRTRICRNSGKWKDAYDEVAYECRDTSGGLVNDTRICNIWWAKPADRNSNVSDSSCNEPSWTTRECDASNCSGKCNGDTVSVQCRREYRDWYGTVYNRETKSESRQCYGACEGGVCNPSVNGLNVSWTDWSWPSNTTLCSYGTVIEKNFNTNPNVYLNKWSWKCRGHSSTTPVSCTAHKPNTNAWRCDQNRINSCVKVGNPNPKAGKPVAGFQNGKQWVCENEGNMNDVYCTQCDSGYQGTVYDQDQPAQCVKIDQQREQPCSGTKPTGTEYVFGSTTYTQTSSDGGVNWTPAAKSWTYTSKTNPWACEYTCNAGYSYKNWKCEKNESYSWKCVGLKSGRYWSCNWHSNEASKIAYKDCKQILSSFGGFNGLKQESIQEIEINSSSFDKFYECFVKKMNTFFPWVGSCFDRVTETDCSVGFTMEVWQKFIPCEWKPLGSLLGESSYNTPLSDISIWDCQDSNGKKVEESLCASIVKPKVYTCSDSIWCKGPVPANVIVASSSEIPSGGQWKWKLVTQNSSAPCELICANGYTLQNGVCVEKQYRCTGQIPENASLVKWDDIGLREDTKRKLVQKDGSAKCEYVCDTKNGYTFDNGACVKPTKPQTKKIRCGGELPENVEDTSTHYEDVECMYNSTTKKYDCPEVKWKYKFSIWERSSEREILLEDCGCGYSSDNNDVWNGWKQKWKDTIEELRPECTPGIREFCSNECWDSSSIVSPTCKFGLHKMIERTPRICEFQCSPWAYWNQQTQQCEERVFNQLNIHRRSKCDDSSLNNKEWWICEKNERFGVSCPLTLGSYSIACYKPMSPAVVWNEGESCFCKWKIDQEAGWYQWWWHIFVGKLDKYWKCRNCTRETFNYGLNLWGNRNSHHPWARKSIEENYIITPSHPRINQHWPGWGRGAGSWGGGRGR